MPELRLHALAHARSGDKGNRLNIALVAYAPELFPLLCEAVTESVVAKLFAHRRPSAVKRYVLPKLNAMNFVIDDILDGGVTQSLNLDSHGKTLSYRLLGMSIMVSDELTRFARPHLELDRAKEKTKQESPAGSRWRTPHVSAE